MCISWKGEPTFDFIGRTDDRSPLFRSYPYAADIYDDGQFRGATPDIAGRIIYPHVEGYTPRPFVGAVDRGAVDRDDSPSTIYAGFWRWTNNPPYPAVEAIVGSTGKALIAYWTSFFAGEDALTRVNANGEFSVTLSGGTRVSGRIDIGARRLVVAFGAESLPPTSQSEGRLGNFSILSAISTPGDKLVQQFTIVGEKDKSLLLRGVGSPLALLQGPGSYLADPAIEVWDTKSVKVAANDDWTKDDPFLLNATQRVGALPLPANSRDAALVKALPRGVYTLLSRSYAADATGALLTEVFDLGSEDSQLSHFASRGRASGGDALISGFTISGDTPVQVLVRALGPRLADFGVADALADPKLKITTSSGVTVIESDDWNSSDVALVSALRRRGGTYLRRPSKDAAVLVTLAPGAYVASVQGAAGSSGIAQIETTLPQLTPASDATLAIELFKVNVWPAGDYYYYEPQELLVYGTETVSPMFVTRVRFGFVDAPGERVVEWQDSQRVDPGLLVDLIPRDAYFREPMYSWGIAADASHMSVTITFRDRDQVEHTVTALAQVTRKR